MNGPINKGVSSALPSVFSRRSAILKIVEEKALGDEVDRKHAVHRRHLEPSPATHASEDGRKVRNGMEFVPRVEISIFCTKKNKSKLTIFYIDIISMIKYFFQ